MTPTKPVKAVRRFCLDCQGSYSASVQSCTDTACQLHGYRLGTLEPLPQEARPLRAIRLYCLACAGDRHEVRVCDAGNACALWSFRFGVFPETFKRVVARRRKEKEELLLPGMKAWKKGIL